MFDVFLNNTQLLALIGAFSGVFGSVIGLLNFYLRLRQFSADKSKLTCKVIVDFKHGLGSVFRNVKIEISSIGRRPVNIDFLEVLHSPDGIQNRIKAMLKWRKGLWVTRYFVSDKAKVLTENSKITCSIEREKLDFATARKIRVVDQTGKRWKVKHSNLSKIPI